MKRVAFAMTHPTQYHSPWFRALAASGEIDIHVFYGVIPSLEEQGTGFGIEFQWDVPLLEGYPHTVLRNTGSGILNDFGGVDSHHLPDVVRKGGFDAWVINGWRSRYEWRAIKSCWKEKVPMFIRGDSNFLTPRSLPVRAAKWMLYRRWVPRFSCYLTVGALNEDYYLHYGADRSRFVPVRHFVDNDWFAKRAVRESADVHATREMWKVGNEKVVLLFAGKFIEKKSPMSAIRAMETVKNSAHLVMVGDGPLRAECEQYAASRNLPITFAGFLNQANMPRAYAAADVLIVPSIRDETWGLVVNEAMACGLPAIVSDQVGCAPDLVIDGSTGLVFRAGSVDALVDCIEAYTSRPDLISIHGRAAHERVQSYSVTSAVRGTVEAAERFAA